MHIKSCSACQFGGLQKPRMHPVFKMLKLDVIQKKKRKYTRYTYTNSQWHKVDFHNLYNLPLHTGYVKTCQKTRDGTWDWGQVQEMEERQAEKWDRQTQAQRQTEKKRLCLKIKMSLFTWKKKEQRRDSLYNRKQKRKRHTTESETARRDGLCGKINVFWHKTKKY